MRNNKIGKFVKSAILSEKENYIREYTKKLNRKLDNISSKGYAPIARNYQRIMDFLRANPEIARINKNGEFRYSTKNLTKIDAREIDRLIYAIDGQKELNLTTKVLNPKNNYVNILMKELYGDNAKQYSNEELGSIEEVMKIARTMQEQNDDFELLDFDSDAVAMWARNNYNNSPESVIRELSRISKLPQSEWIEALQTTIEEG